MLIIYLFYKMISIIGFQQITMMSEFLRNIFINYANYLYILQNDFDNWFSTKEPKISLIL